MSTCYNACHKLVEKVKMSFMSACVYTGHADCDSYLHKISTTVVLTQCSYVYICMVLWMHKGDAGRNS